MVATVLSPSDVVRVPVRANGREVFTLLDAEDMERLGSLSLSLGSHGYAQMWWGHRVTLVHRWVLGLEKGDRRIGDHINGDRLDNRRANLRAVTASGSSQNVPGRGKSKYRGVSQARSGRWTAQVQFQGVVYHLGTFATEQAAALAADQKRRELMPDYVGLRMRSDNFGVPDPRTDAGRRRARREAEEVRAWARDRGLEVPEVGRIPVAVRRAFDAAHPLNQQLEMWETA